MRPRGFSRPAGFGVPSERRLCARWGDCAGRAGAESKDLLFFYALGGAEKQVHRLGPASASSQKRAGCVTGLALARDDKHGDWVADESRREAVRRSLSDEAHLYQ